MPSEALSQEPRDRGPPPPVTRAGRSAQLAKAATTPGPERRPRGRPRKDGSGGRVAAPAPLPPPPPPLPKSRKKGRSRGRAQVEDEESTGPTEAKAPEETEVKEKPIGRRRSTSRRKPSKNLDPNLFPEPGQDSLSTHPELDLDHGSPQHDPTVPKSSPEPSPSAKEDGRSPVHGFPIPASGPRESPQHSPLPVSPFLSPDPIPVHSPEPAPDPVKEYSGPPLWGVVCSPSTVPVETSKVGVTPEASPMEQSPSLSPCSTPPVSPCVCLEDEDSLSHLFQRSLSEDSGGSPTPSLGHTKRRLKQCAFCYHGDTHPPMGQGRLVVFGPTPGYIPLHILKRRTSSDRDSDCHDHCYRGDQAPSLCSSPDQSDFSSEFLEQLGPIGLPHDIDVQLLFDPTGQCCAHLQCAAWSEGVRQGEGQSLLYVDKAIDSGSTQVCAFCCRLGASLRCRETGCGRSYHFPCAAAAGANQDWRQRRTLCTRHAHTAQVLCTLCSGGGEPGNLLMCCCCGDHYHGSCLDPPLVPSPLLRTGWQCPRCRSCQSCRTRGDGMLLVCERCDKSYHTHCLSPPLEHTNTPSTWSCKNCRTCRSCGVTSSGVWANHPFLCKSCDPAQPCPLCGHAPDLYAPQEYLTCTCCYRCIHMDCMLQAGESRIGSKGYVCSTCRPQEENPILCGHTQTLAFSFAEALSVTSAAPTVVPVELVSLKQLQSPGETISTTSQQSPVPPHPVSPELRENPGPMELRQSPGSTDFQQSPDPPEIQQRQHPPHLSPVVVQQHPDSTELQHSPVSPEHPQSPDRTDLQHSPGDKQPQSPVETISTTLQQSPVPPHPVSPELRENPGPMELRQSPGSTDLQQSPDPPEIQQRQHPPHLSPIVVQQYPDSTEHQHSPVPPEHPQSPDRTDLQHSPGDKQPQSPVETISTTSQQSPVPPHPVSPELRENPGPIELRQSPGSTNLQQSPDPPEIQQRQHPLHLSPIVVQQHPDSTELQHSPVPPEHPQSSDRTDLQHSPNRTDLQHSPDLQQSPDRTDLQHSPDATQHQHSPDPTVVQQNPYPTVLQKSPDPTDGQRSPDPTYVRQSPIPTELLQITDPTDIRHSLVLSPREHRQNPNPTDLWQCPCHVELHKSPQLPHHDPTELTQGPHSAGVMHSPDPTNFQQRSGPLGQENSLPSHPNSKDLQKSPVPTDLLQTSFPTDLSQSPIPTYLPRSPGPAGHPRSPGPAGHPRSPGPSPADHPRSPGPGPADHPRSPGPGPTDHPRSPGPLPGPTDHPRGPGPVDLPQNPIPTDLPQSPVPSHLSHNPNPMDCPPSPVSMNLQHSFSPADLQQPPATSHSDLLGPQESHSIYLLSTETFHFQSEATDLQKLTSPSTPVPAELQQSPVPGTSTQAHHSAPSKISTKNQHSPAQASPEFCSITHLIHTCPPSPSQHSTPPHSPVSTLDREIPGNGAVQDISTLDQDLSLVYCMPVQMAQKPITQWPASAPCSPSPIRPTWCSLSQPASPVQSHCPHPSWLADSKEPESRVHEPSQPSPKPDGQTLETSLAPLSPASELSLVASDSHLPTQTCLDHSGSPRIPASSPPSSLVYISSLTGVPQIPLPSASSPHANKMPASPGETLQACVSPRLTETVATACPAEGPTHPTWSQEEIEAAIEHPRSVFQTEVNPSCPGRLIHSNTDTNINSNAGCGLRGAIDTQANSSSCSFTEFSLMQESSFLPGPSSPSQTCPAPSNPLHVANSFSPPHCSSVSHVHSDLSLCSSGASCSTSRSSPAGQASPEHTQSISNSAHSGPVQSPLYSSSTHASVAHGSPPHTLTKSSDLCCSPISSSAPKTSTTSDPTIAQLSPVLASPPTFIVDMEPRSVVQSSASPSQFPNTCQLSAAKSQQSGACLSPISERPPTCEDATSTQGSPSPIRSPSASLTCAQQASPVLSSSVASPVSVVAHTPGPDNPLHSPEGSSSHGSASFAKCETSSGHATFLQSDSCRLGPEQPEPGPQSPQQYTEFEDAEDVAKEHVQVEERESPAKLVERTREGGDQENLDCSSSGVQQIKDLPPAAASPQHTPLVPLEDRPQEIEPTSGRADEEGLDDESTKGKNQSQADPLEKWQVSPEPPVVSGEVVSRRESVGEKQEVKQKGAEQESEEEDPMSPVLDLDTSSFDMEVMDLMASASSPPPVSLRLSPHTLAPSACRVKGRTLRSPPFSDDLTLRLRQSPFSTEASPETSPCRTPITPPPLSPPSPHARESPLPSKDPATPVLLLTPKIGMGKPAISKRKFSPGRARVRQGSWWSTRRVASPPSSSQDSTCEVGRWDSPKPRPQDSTLWSMRVGRGSGFPGRRRARGGGVGGGRGGRGRSRLKTQDRLTMSPGGVYVEPFQPKDDEENSMHNTVVMFSTSDHFTLRQDMCVVCGSFGQGAEGRLLACSQCGQCYHPYCVNVKVTRVVLTKGWRCLECTVCEACGEASDPGRLLLCDDCDISYHTYCLDPPLHTVPKGAWKCKWCVWCVQCGSTSPGLNCDWQSNYSRCGPCASLSRCPVCQRLYSQDELILQCQQCDRWVHAVCQGLTMEDEVEVAADDGFDCSLCRTHSRGSYGRSDSIETPFMAQIITRIREPDKTYTQDGVCLTESGLSHLQALVEPLTSPRRYRRSKPKLKLRIINQNSVSVLQTPLDPDLPTEPDHSRGESEIKSDSSPERDPAHDDDATAKEIEVVDGNKKRKRKPYRPGIGGFMVRQRGGKSGPSRIKLCRKDSSEMLPGQEEGLLDADVPMETGPATDPVIEKVKKRYRKKKTKLEEAFPSYLQEAFFGRDLLDRSQQQDRKAGTEMPAAGAMKCPTFGLQGSFSSGPVATSSTRKLPSDDAVLVDLCDVLSTNPHILATGPSGHFHVERSPSPFAGLDIGPESNTASTQDATRSSGCGPRMAPEEPLDAILSPELDKMVSDGAILSKLYKIPELEGKDVEEVFTAVLSPDASDSQSEQSQQHHAAATKTQPPHPAAAFSRLPLMNGLMGASPQFANAPMMPSVGYRVAPPNPAPSPAPVSQVAAAAVEGEQDTLTTAQRGMLKWEKEETLGELATVAPVLYCNVNFPQLREQYPDWSSRVKQIAKLWRKASSQDRAPFVQKARDNRAAQRINKAQLSNDALKRHQPPPPPPPQQQQLQLPQPLPSQYDLVSMETEAAFKDPLRPKESEQEQEWKFRQQMRQKSKQLAKMEATQKLEQVKHEQRQQQLRLAGHLSPEAGGRSPGTPTPRQHPHVPQGADDVFLRPQAPPPSGFPSPHSTSPLHQPPSSPQVFSPPSSRPSSPWDPYTKVVGTPRPTSTQPGPTPQRRNSLSASPAHDTFGSPAPSPDPKTPDVSRALAPPPGLQQARPGMLSPSSGSVPDHTSRLLGIRVAETLQRPPHSGIRAGDQVQSGVFKAPMPPQHQVQQEVFGGGARRDPSRPTDVGFPLHQSQDSPFPSSPLSALGSPHRSPYAQNPGTPRPDYSQQTSDPFSLHQSPLSSRPSPDHYANPQTPSTPRPHSDPTYLPTPSTMRLDQYTPQTTNQRPSPSHTALDPYASNPGTPRPSVPERFPRSPGSQRSADPYAQQPSTPRPQKTSELFSDGFSPQGPMGSGSSPLAPVMSGEMASYNPMHLQSPGRQHQQLDSFPRPPSSQTPKHPGISDEGCFSGPSQPDLTAANDVAVLDGTMSMMPQLGDSEEKLRQRQRLRQHLLRQQQQKSALKGHQELVSGQPASAPAPVSGTPLHWSQEDSTAAAAPADPFGRPPPPYPGTVTPGGPAGALALAPRFPGGFPGEQQRSFTPSEGPFVRQSLPRELGVRGPAPRFPAPPGASQGPVPRPALEGVPVPLRKLSPGEFTGIRPGPISAVPQSYLQSSLPIQQHSIMGQPYIELRHRTPETRLRLPFPTAVAADPELPPVRSGQGPQLDETPLALEQLKQQDQQHLGPAAEVVLPRPDGMEEHLEAEDSTVKDLDDVEVKDLVDLNLNLDPEDGKEDLDLHLDDFLLFDLIADPDTELNLEDHEELDLGDPMEERDGSGSRKSDGQAHLLTQVKQEGKDDVTVARQPMQQPQLVATARPEAGAGALLPRDKMEEPGPSTAALLALQVQEQALPPTVAGPQSVFQQRPFGAPTALLASHPQGIPVSSHVTPHVPPVQPRLFIPQVQPPQPGPSTQIQSAAVFNQNQAPNQIKSKPLLLEEQPLLLQDLLDQERQEQQQQKQMQALIRQRSTPDPVFPNMDLDSITDPIMKAKMVALKGINKVMTQGSLALNPLVINRFQQTPGAPGPEGTSQPPLPAGQETKVNPQLVKPDPPSFSPGFVNDSQRRQYEEWLGETQQLLQMQQRLLEDQIAAHRKTKKALSAKQRTAKKAGRVFAEEDAAQLRCVTEQQGAVQKQLEQIRKQQKDHAELIEDYRTKQQQRALQQPPAAVPPIPQTMVPLQPHTPNVQSGWAPGVMLQRVPPQTPAMVASFTAGPRGSSGPSGDSAASTPQVKFDDNNPFSEGFQERERRERLREQQERQRVQLMQEVERHRALQQRLGLEQQGHLGPPMGPGAGTRVGPAPGPGGPTAPTPAGDSLSQMPFFSSELPQEFPRSAPPPRPLSQHQMEAPLPHQGFTAGPSVPGGPQAPSGVSGAAADQASVLLEHSSPVDLARLRLSGPASVQGPVHLAGTLAAPSHSGDQSSPSRVLHLSSDDKPKMRSRRKDGDDGGGAQTPLSSHSDDATAPATPQASSDTSCSTPTQANTDRSDSQELLTRIAASLRAPLTAAAQEVKVERDEGAACREGAMKMEDGEGLPSPSPLYGGDAGKELLRHLLRDKTSDFRFEGEEEDGSGYHNNSADNLDPDPSIRKKTQRCNKRLAGRPDKDRALPKHKRRKREEEDDANSTSDQLVTQLRQLAALPLMEPVLGVDLSLFPPYGSSSLGRDSRLSGSFGNASLDGVTDYYSQLICQNNLSNPPTPPASLPPTPPPVSRQKLVNGFATTEELARKELGEQDGVSGLKQKREEPLTLNHTSKTVDVPASLPTPPHNNQEELRVQDVSERDSPDGFIPSSSPESLADGEVSRYPDLSFIKLEPLSPCSSPTIPTAPCAWGKGSAVKLEAKAEPNPQGLSSCSSTDLVTIAMTVNAVAAQNIAGVMTAVAELLRVPVPADYQLTQLAAPESNPLTLLGRVRTPLVQGSSGRQQRPVGIRMDYIQHSSLVPAKYCSYCKGLLGNGVHVVKVLKQEDQSRPGSSLVFCSTNCSALYATAKNKATGLVLQSGSEQPLPSKAQHHYANNISSIAVHSLPQTLPSISTATTSSSSSPPSFPPASAITMETRPHTDSLKVKVKLKPLPRAVSGEEDSSWHGKKMKSSRWRRWSVSITLSRGPCAPNAAVAMPTEEELDVLLKLGACLRPDPLPKDQRRCCFCHQQGDGQTDGPARLLNLDLDLWVHLNCALWSSEVYETQAGALINVELALRRGLTLRCAHCQQTGATSGCNRLRCTNTYHFTCALQAHCTFFKDKTMLCHLHKPRTVYLVGDRSTGSSPPSTPGPTPDPMVSSDPYDSELRCFAVFRRVYVQRDEARQIAAVVQRGERQHTFRVGSLLFRAVGRLLPHQMNTFHNKTAIFPVGYHVNRIYWSMRQSNRRCKYMCYIEDNDGQPLFKVKVVEKGHDDLVLTGTTPKAVWDQILEPVAQLRSSTGTLKLFPGYLKGEDLFGLTTSAVTRIIESLPGVEACERYIFRYGRNPLMEWPLAFNPSGSARSEPKACQAKRTHLLTSIASRCQGSVGSIVGLVPGVISLSPGESVAGAHQGRHSKSSQYRRMKAEWKSNVYLARSRIQGLGLYAARDIEKCTMVIEYIGTIIRSEVANRKERLYESQNRGVYMFRIDNDYVIDATITGGPARYINHSCAPNCITEVVTVEKENKIVISSCRRIQRGEELCYDYKFDLEDDQHKLPCHCGAVNCRKWMN